MTRTRRKAQKGRGKGSLSATTEKMRRVKIYIVAVNDVHEEMVVNLCNTYLVESTLRGEEMIILDTGAPISLAG